MPPHEAPPRRRPFRLSILQLRDPPPPHHHPTQRRLRRPRSQTSSARRRPSARRAWTARLRRPASTRRAARGWRTSSRWASRRRLRARRSPSARRADLHVFASADGSLASESGARPVQGVGARGGGAPRRLVRRPPLPSHFCAPPRSAAQDRRLQVVGRLARRFSSGCGRCWRCGMLPRAAALLRYVECERDRCLR